ncbi:MAG: SusD/RagB family nutrient-binding outer membrane lipoprotein [Flavobacteriaceae bacterium]
MKQLKSTVLVALLFFISCDVEFEEINTNPNLIDQISPGTLLNEIIYNMNSNNIRKNYDITSELMQVVTYYPKYYGGVQRYEILPTTGDSQWNSSYKWLKNVSEMLQSAEDHNAPNYIAIALTLKAWIYSNLTDCFGNIPYSEASKADEGLLKAGYDTQEFIYTKTLEDLETANSLYDHEKGMVYGSDILFENNTRLWQKFTNSLRLRLLLRVSDVRPNSYQDMVAIIDDPSQYPIIDHISESAIFSVSGAAPNLSPWSRYLDFSNNHAVSDFFIEILNDLEDPRIPFLVTPAREQGQDIGYKGIPSGYDEQIFTYTPSYMNHNQIIAPMDIPILTYSEVEFIKSELAQKGYLPDAESHYKEGIRAAIALITGEVVTDDYFTKPTAAYDGSLERIMLHKYLALYFTDYQQWSEYRRTGYPVLPTTNSMLNNAVLPSRLLYPEDQPIYNPVNYEQASQSMGGDDINSKVWWDVN